MKEKFKPEGPPYINNQNVALTKALFWENYQTAAHPKYLPVFCLYGQRPGLISCQETFIAERDPSGRKWAMKYLKDWNHFQKLLKTSYFKEAYDHWCEELEAIMQSEALERIQELMSSDKEATAFAASKYIAEKAWKEKPTKRGRPSKAELEGEKKRLLELSEEERDDLTRIGLVVDNTKGAS